MSAQGLYFEACKLLMREMKVDLAKGREAMPSGLSIQYCEYISLPQINYRVYRIPARNPTDFFSLPYENKNYENFKLHLKSAKDLPGYASN